MLWHVLVPPAVVSQSTPAEEDRRLMQKREGPHVQSGVEEEGRCLCLVLLLRWSFPKLTSCLLCPMWDSFALYYFSEIRLSMYTDRNQSRGKEADRATADTEVSSTFYWIDKLLLNEKQLLIVTVKRNKPSNKVGCWICLTMEGRHCRWDWQPMEANPIACWVVTTCLLKHRTSWVVVSKKTILRIKCFLLYNAFKCY